MLNLTGYPAKAVAYVMKSIAPLAHGQHALRLPPENFTVGGTKYDVFCDGEGRGITFVICHADADHQMIEGRYKIVADQLGKAAREVAKRKGQLQKAKSDLGKSGADMKPYHTSQVEEYQAKIEAAEAEQTRLKSVLEDCGDQLKNWQAQESKQFLYSELGSHFFNLTESVSGGGITETPLEEVMRRIREDDAYAVAQIRFVMPDRPLANSQVESFLCLLDLTDREAVNQIMRTVLQEREVAASRISVPELLDGDSELGGSPGGVEPAESVLGVPGAGGEAGEHVHPAEQQPAKLGSGKATGRAGR